MFYCALLIRDKARACLAGWHLGRSDAGPGSWLQRRFCRNSLRGLHYVQASKTESALNPGGVALPCFAIHSPGDDVAFV